MQLFPLIFGTVLLPKACTLICHSCDADVSETCEDKELMCPPLHDRCAAMRVTSYIGTNRFIDMKIKGCFPEEMCDDGSLNNGFFRHLISIKCCPTDLCNKNDTSELSRHSPNGKKCYYCLGEGCKETLNCEGNEDYCITLKEKKMKTKGCASKNICYGALSEALQESIGAKFSCCEGDFCNSASSTRAGLLLPLALFVSLVTFS